jgi:hypothetical protein
MQRLRSKGRREQCLTNALCCMRRKMHECISEGRHLHGVYRCQHYRGRMAIGAESFLRAYLCCKSA